MNGSPTRGGCGLGPPAEAAAPELVAPARAAFCQLVLREVAHEVPQEIEEALHFLWRRVDVARHASLGFESIFRLDETRTKLAHGRGMILACQKVIFTY
jgi:hypothetical protein